LKCYRASPYGELYCELDKGHEGPCFDGNHSFTEDIDIIGRSIIFNINKNFGLHILVTEETSKKMSAIIDGIIDHIMERYELGNCSDCDQRMPDEPSYNEGYF